jgi:glutamate dehydrogenase (NAD(P)+)
VIDNLACGPAIGGVRMAANVSVEECVHLARAMTLKNAAAGLAHGGGKSVIFGDPMAQPEGTTIRAFARDPRPGRVYPRPRHGHRRALRLVKDEIEAEGCRLS